MNGRKNAGIIVIVLLVLIFASVFLYRGFDSHRYGVGYGGHMMSGMGMWGMGGWMLVFWGLVLFGLILIISWLFTLNRNEKKTGNLHDDVEEILRNRYAKGDIDSTQFKKMREELSR